VSDLKITYCSLAVEETLKAACCFLSTQILI
jgi:hypothetical protein